MSACVHRALSSFSLSLPLSLPIENLCQRFLLFSLLKIRNVEISVIHFVILAGEFSSFFCFTIHPLWDAISVSIVEICRIFNGTICRYDYLDAGEQCRAKERAMETGNERLDIWIRTHAQNPPPLSNILFRNYVSFLRTKKGRGGMMLLIRCFSILGSIRCKPDKKSTLCSWISKRVRSAGIRTQSIFR